MAREIRFIQNPGRRAVVYARYSSEAQKEASIGQQINAAREYADAHGYVIDVDDIYADPAVSGTTIDRPMLTKLRYDVTWKRPAVLIVWKTDRISRDPYDAAIIKNDMRLAGVRIEYVAEYVPEDDEATRILIEKLHEGIAAGFIITHRKNVMRGMKDNAEKCLYNGRKLLGYIGRPNERYEIDPETAPVVRRIFSEYVDDKPMTWICADLNRAGVRTSTGGEFTVNSVRHILRNNAYIGVYKWGEYVDPDGMPAIIDKELFDEARKKLERNRRNGGNEGKKAAALMRDEQAVDFWLSGHLYCGLCHENGKEVTLNGVSGTGKSGKKFYYYACQHAKKHQCGLKPIRKELLERICEDLLWQVTANPAVQFMIANDAWLYYRDNLRGDRSYVDAMIAERKTVEKSLENVMKAIEAGIFNETTQRRMLELEEQRRQLTDKIDRESRKSAEELDLGTIWKYIYSFGADITKPDQRRRILETFVDKVIVYPDRVMLSLRYTNDAPSVKIDEIREIIRVEDETFEETEEEWRALTYTFRKNFFESFDLPFDEEPPASLDLVAETEGVPPF